MNQHITLANFIASAVYFHRPEYVHDVTSIIFFACAREFLPSLKPNSATITFMEAAHTTEPTTTQAFGSLVNTTKNLHPLGPSLQGLPIELFLLIAKQNALSPEDLGQLARTNKAIRIAL